MNMVKLYDDELPANAVSQLLAIFAGQTVSVPHAQTIAHSIAKYCTRGTILHLMRHDRGSVRFIGIEALRVGTLELDDEVGDLLLSAIDDHIQVAAAAIKTMGQKQYSQAIDEIAACLAMQNPIIVAAAIQTMLVLDKTQITPELILKSLTSHTIELFTAAARAALALELVEAAPLIFDWLQTRITSGKPLKLTNRRINNTYKVAIKSLGVFGYTEAIPVLHQIATQQHGLRTPALKSLALLGVDITDLAHELYAENPTQSLATLLGILTNAQGHSITANPALSQQAPVSIPSRTKAIFNKNMLIIQTLGEEFGVGSVCTGTVIVVTPKYALIDLMNGLRGKLGLEELRWRKTANLVEHLEVGQSVTVIVTQLNSDGRIELSMRQCSPEPWANLEAHVSPNHILTGIVEDITDFGVFVWIEAYQVTGLVHISEMPDALVATFTDHYQIGQEIPVQVLKVQAQHQRLSLTLRLEADQAAGDEEVT